jgi:hypothetical protein
MFIPEKMRIGADAKRFRYLSKNLQVSVHPVSVVENLIGTLAMVDILDRQSDAKKTTSNPHSALLADWHELDKKAVKATDEDISNLTKSIKASWTDVSTLAKIAGLDTQTQSKSTLDALANNGPVKIDAATKLAYKSGELTVESIAEKVGSVGAELASWFFGGNETKCEAPKTTANSKSYDVKSAGKSSNPAVLPSTHVAADGIVFGVIENLTGQATTTASSVKPESQKLTETLPTANNDRTENKPEVKVENGKVLFSNSEKGVQVTRAEDGTINAKVENKESGTIGEVISAVTGSRIYKEGERQIYKFIDSTHFEAANFRGEGKKITQTHDGKPVAIITPELVTEVSDNSVFFADNVANTLQEALDNIKKSHPEQFKKENSMTIWYKNGGALIHPSLDRMIEFKRTPEGVELHYALSDGSHLRYSPQGKLYIVGKDQTVKELSSEQTKKVLEGLGDKAEIVRTMLANLKAHKPIQLPDGQTISLEDNNQTIKSVTPGKTSTDGTVEKPTEVVMNTDGWKFSTQTHSASFVEKTGKLVTADEEGKPVSIDLKSDKLDMVTEDFVRKDGEVTFVKTNVKIKENGAVDLPDKTQISAHNDVRFSDGSTLSRDGTLVSADGKVIYASSNLPQKSNLDAFISQALSMANSVASRVQSGSCSPSEIALIEANMSIVQNFINMFSIAGNLPMANSLIRSWAILKESHNRATSETDLKSTADKTREDEIRAFLDKLARESSNTAISADTNLVTLVTTPALVR